MVGIGLNVGFLGLHPWLVDSYPRPHVAASVVLCGFTTKVGVYALARAFPGGHDAIAAMGGAMVLVGVTLAILQTEVRRLLTYHIVSQVGYMVAGVGVGSALGRAGGMAHLLNNVLYKSLLFMVGGWLILRTDSEKLKRIGGLARETPVLFATYAVAAFAIAGVPGFNGFVSKGMVIDSADAADLDLLWWALVVGGVGTVVSFAKFGYYAFLGERRGESDSTVARLSPVEAAPLVAVALACVLLGLFPDLLFALVPPGTDAAKVFVVSQFTKAGAVLVAGLAAFALLKRPSRVSVPFRTSIRSTTRRAARPSTPQSRRRPGSPALSTRWRAPGTRRSNAGGPRGSPRAASTPSASASCWSFSSSRPRCSWCSRREAAETQFRRAEAFWAFVARHRDFSSRFAQSLRRLAPRTVRRDDAPTNPFARPRRGRLHVETTVRPPRRRPRSRVRRPPAVGRVVRQ
ncbi:proton-conducting transporter membrane subunit [Halorussus caseinilyticus]|uniref:Proton-conducting transporter membrane subunit n=1 Tax=Halorussus caseinilyticus TaxID=3034025 RepID=A0ABD5WR88_9EURY